MQRPLSARLLLLIALSLPAAAIAAETVVQFGAPSMTVREAGPGVLVEVKRTGSVDGRSEVRWMTVAGSATAGSDFGTLFEASAPSGVITFLAGEHLKQILVGPAPPDPMEMEGDTPYVRILPSPGFEPSESFTIRLTGTQVGAQADIAVEIAAHGRAVAFSNSRTDVAAGSSTAVLTVERIGDATEGVSVQFRTRDVASAPGRAYTPVSGDLTWAPGDMDAKRIAIPLLGDAARGPVLAVELSDPLNASLLGPAIALVVKP